MYYILLNTRRQRIKFVLLLNFISDALSLLLRVCFKRIHTIYIRLTKIMIKKLLEDIRECMISITLLSGAVALARKLLLLDQVFFYFEILPAGKNTILLLPTFESYNHTALLFYSVTCLQVVRFNYYYYQ